MRSRSHSSRYVYNYLFYEEYNDGTAKAFLLTHLWMLSLAIQIHRVC